MLKSDPGGLTVYLDGLYEYALPAASETVMGEVGYINDALTHADTTVVLGRSYNNPVVFAQPISQDENDVAVVRITDVQADRFTLHVDEAPNHDGAHTTEAVSYIVLEAGSWQLPDGTLLEVGTVETAATVGSALSDQWESVLFSQEFTVAPVVLSQVQTDNDPHWVKSRQQLATTTGVNIALEEEEGKTTPHGAETVGWLAIEPGTGEWNGHLFEAALTADAVTHSWYSFSFGQSFSVAPRFLAGLASYDSDESAHLRYRRAQLTAAGAQVRAEEDSVFDSEYAHTTETAAYLAIQGDGELSATGGMSGPASTSYYETQGGAMAMRRAGYPSDNGIFYILSDHLGSSSVILAQDGTVAKRDYYYPYGGNRGTPYTDVTTRRFTGQYHEAGLPGGEGLSFYNARWYDPQLGRFISADTIVPEPQNPQDFNRYTYARGNPVRFSDPTGHVCYDPGLDAARPGNCNGGTKPSPTMPTGTPGMFGLTFTGNWSPSQRRTALNVAIEIELALWRAGNFKGRYVVGATFRAIYGNQTLHSSDIQEYRADGRPIGARTDSGQHKIIFFEAGLNASTINFRYNVAHELGHAFNANALDSDPTPANPNRVSGRPYRDLQGEGIWVGQVPIAGGTPYTRTDRGYQPGINDIAKPYQQNTDWESGEDFADMFANWAFNSFANDPFGAARGQWMNNHMSSWIGLAVAANR